MQRTKRIVDLLPETDIAFQKETFSRNRLLYNVTQIGVCVGGVRHSISRERYDAFALFYLVNSMLVNGGNRVEGRPTWRLFLISFVGNILGIVVLIFIQYFGIIVNGTFTFNSMRIVNLFPLVVLIPAGTVITHFFYKLTGKIYAGSFMVSMLYTMMTVSNTMFTASVLG